MARGQKVFSDLWFIYVALSWNPIYENRLMVSYRATHPLTFVVVSKVIHLLIPYDVSKHESVHNIKQCHRNMIY